MSAECEKHGVDLHGDTFSGLICPVCEAKKETASALERVEGYRLVFEEIQRLADRDEVDEDDPEDKLAAIWLKTVAALDTDEGER